jgi:RNA polymerase sigma factor (sigma-70 family)
MHQRDGCLLRDLAEILRCAVSANAQNRRRTAGWDGWTWMDLAKGHAGLNFDYGSYGALEDCRGSMVVLRLKAAEAGKAIISGAGARAETLRTRVKGLLEGSRIRCVVGRRSRADRRIAGTLKEHHSPLDDRDQNLLLSSYLERRADLVRYFRARLRSDEAAEDLVQDIYLKISNLPAPEIGNPVAYLYRLGTNLMLDRLKAQRRAGRRDGEWRDLHSGSVGGEDVADASPADDVTDARQRLRRIIAVVNELPPPMREAFRLHKLEGLSHAETARAMGVSRSSVEKYMMTCLKRILAKVGR